MAFPAEAATPRGRTPWADNPLTLAVAVTFGAGALLSLPFLPAAPWFAAAALPALIPWRGRALYAGVCLGFLLAGLSALHGLQQRWSIARDGETITATGAVTDLPERTASAHRRATTSRFLFRPAAGSGLPPRVRASWYRALGAPAGGECWRLRLKLKAPHGSADPGAFDYEAWLFAQGIGATAVVKAGWPCGNAPGFGWLRLRERLRQRLNRWLADVPGHALVNTLVLGDRSGLTQRDWAVFRATGTNHFVAVAGLHLGIIAAAAYFLCRWLWTVWPAVCLRLPAQKAGMIGAALAGATYAALSGFALPAIRAAVMLAAAVLAVLIGGARSLTRGLALAWLAIVLIDPLALLSASLWLSFGAVALIAYVTGGRLVPRPRWRELLWLQLSLSLGLIPLTLWFFGGASWVAPLANLLVVPAAALLLPALFVALLLALTVPAVGLPLLKAMAVACWALRRLLGALAATAPHAWFSLTVDPSALALAALGILLLLAPRAWPVRPLGFACLLPLAWPATQTPPLGSFRLSVLDVGEGLAAVVQTHRHALLFDAGPAYPGGLDMGEAVVVPYLRAHRINRLDLLLISHRDLDHRGGAPAVRAALPVEREIGALSNTPCRDGQHWRWDGVDFAILNPPADATGSRNNLGCVLRVASGEHAALLPADIEATAERRLLGQHRDRVSAAVLVAPHHGSAGSSSAGFVAAVSPRLVIYPAGWENQFHFPRPQVRARYAAVGARQLQTGAEGAIRVEIDPDGLRAVRRYRCDHPRLWRALPPVGCRLGSPTAAP